MGPTCRRRIDRTGPTVQRQNGRWQNMSEAERQTTIAVLISSRDIDETVKYLYTITRTFYKCCNHSFMCYAIAGLNL
jgi:hypothetical protein